MSTPNRMQIHWEASRSFIKKEWPRFSDTTIKNINGDFDRFLKYLQEIYDNFPLEEARAREKLQGFFNSLEQ